MTMPRLLASCALLLASAACSDRTSQLERHWSRPEVLTYGLSSPGGLALSRDGRTLWVADRQGLRRVDTATGEVHDWPQTDLAMLPFPKVGAPDNVAGGDGVLWMTSFSASSVRALDPSSGEVRVVWTDIAVPTAVLPWRDGSVLIAQATGEILRIRSDGQRSLVARDFELPVALAVGAATRESGSIYVAEASSGTITEIRIGENSRREIAAGLHRPVSMVLDPDGHLLVIEAGLQSLLRIDPASGMRRILADDLPLERGVGADREAPLIPVGLAVGSDGTIYFSSLPENAVFKLVAADVVRR